MKKIPNLLLAILYCFSAIADEGIHFEKNMTWAQVKAKALRENKMIFFDAFTTWCGPCKYLEESVYTDMDVSSYFNTNYINVKFDMENGEGIGLAEEFNITSYPTLLFFSAKGELVHKYIGAMKAPDFIDLGKEARDPSKQYFTLKQKVREQQATAEEFIKWTEMSADLEDSDRGKISSGWLEGQDDILANASLAKATLLYCDVTEEQLAYLYKNEERIRFMLGWDAVKTSAILYRKLFRLALQNEDDKTRGGNGFETTIAKFDLEKKQYAKTDLSLFRAIMEEKDAAEGMNILIRSISGENKLNIQEFCTLFLDYSPHFETDQVLQLKEILNNYSIPASEKGMECWLYLAQVICYAKLNEIDMAKDAALKAYNHPKLPEEFKVILEESFGIGE